MSQFSLFMKENKIKKENEKYAATLSLKDEKGQPLEWEFRHITSKENEEIRDSCMTGGKSDPARPRLDVSRYISRLIAASVVYPDLYNAQLQDSYGVNTPEELLFALVDDPGEYSRLGDFVRSFQGFDGGLEEKVKQAKN